MVSTARHGVGAVDLAPPGCRVGSAGTLWACTLFLSAVLTFAVEPLYARMLLPRLGGAPAVWVLSLLFFQVVLLAGYAYAHLLARVRSLTLQVGVHVGALALAALWLPPALPADAGADALTQPALATLRALASGIGVPFAALVATAPLLQHWFARGSARSDPYVLYAASNGGSLAGLLAYPFVLEPLLGARAQARLWFGAYVASVLLVVGCGALACRLSARVEGRRSAAAVETMDAVAPVRMLRWLALAALPAAWLGAASTYVTTAVAPVPLLWVLPLAAYLITLVVAFAPASLLVTRTPAWLRAIGADELIDLIRGRLGLAGRLTVVAAAVAVATRALAPPPLIVGVHLAALFAGALVCHRRLAADRPDPSAATVYYLAIAAGGALGGAFAAVAAPLLFTTPLEYPLVLAACWASGLMAPPRPTGSRPRPIDRTQLRGTLLPAGGVVLALGGAALVAAGALHWGLVPIVLAGAVILTLGALRWPLLAGLTLLVTLVVADGAPLVGGWRQDHVVRSFFGVNRVLTSPDGGQRLLLNGMIGHGIQLRDPARAAEPRGYYTPEGPLGDVLPRSSARPIDRPERVGVIGLGAGGIACYADAGRRVTFFEIDPTVAAIARDPALFTYLSRCPPEAIVIGDGRLSLRGEPTGAMDVLIVDAYSGDTMPLHLLTREALAEYRRVLAPGGVVALHVSNAFFDLEPLVAAFAADAGVDARIREDGTGDDAESTADRGAGWLPSVWMLVGPADDLDRRLDAALGWRPARGRPGLSVWTDDYASPLAVRR